MFQTTKSKKGSVHDVHFVASLATVKVYNGIGWKKRYKAPTDFCFALKPPEVQEKKAHIRYLCAENEFVKWGWYSMVSTVPRADLNKRFLPRPKTTTA